MLNCVNALEHMPVTEQAGLVVTEEKAHHDSSDSERSFRGGREGSNRQPPPLPPARFPNSAV